MNADIGEGQKRLGYCLGALSEIFLNQGIETLYTRKEKRNIMIPRNQEQVMIFKRCVKCPHYIGP
jgi:hypothetical protein